MEIGSVSAIPDLNQWLADHNLLTSWNRGPATAKPFPTYPPFLWKWVDLEHVLTHVGPSGLSLSRGPSPAASADRQAARLLGSNARPRPPRPDGARAAHPACLLPMG